MMNIFRIVLFLAIKSYQSTPHWPWMGSIDLSGFLYDIGLHKYTIQFKSLGIESIHDLPFVLESDLESMKMSSNDIVEFYIGIESMNQLTNSIQHIYDHKLIDQVEKTTLDTFQYKSFYQACSTFDQSLLILDESKSLDLTGLRSLQMMKKLSNQMTQLIEKHYAEPLTEMTVREVLDLSDLRHKRQSIKSLSISSTTKNRKINALITHVRTSIRLAGMEISNLHSSMLRLEGMSSNKCRHLLNNLASLPNGRYLEIGVWKGSSLCNAVNNNEATLKKIIAIDNFSLFGSPREEFHEIMNRCLSESNTAIFQFIDSDAFGIDRPWMDPKAKINIYFYDGRHLEIDHYHAFQLFESMFDNIFVAIVDDWNFEDTRKGTQRALKEGGYKIHFQQILPARRNGDKVQFWNGMAVFVLEKKNGKNNK